jgi:hypothetical protein
VQGKRLPRYVPKGNKMSIKLIPLKSITDGASTLSFMVRKKKSFNLSLLSESIERDGLLYPLVVIKDGDKYLVLDGKKRLNVIRKLAKSNRYTRSMAKVPCIVQEAHAVQPVTAAWPTLLTGPELAHQVILASQESVSLISIAQRFECDLTVVEDCLSLTKLNPELLRHFNNGVISLGQAAAFATIENMTAQYDLLIQLGPFVSDMEIIASIKAGSTVLELSDDNIIILPSRGCHVKLRSSVKQDFGNPALQVEPNVRVAA